LDRAITPSLLQVVHERRAIGRGEGDMLAADLDRTRPVAGVMGEAGRHRPLDDRAHETGIEAHPLALHIGAGLAPEFQRPGVAAEIDADLLQDLVDRRLDAGEAFLAQQVISWNLTANTGDDPGGVAADALRLASLAAAAAPCAQGMSRRM